MFNISTAEKIDTIIDSWFRAANERAGDSFHSGRLGSVDHVMNGWNVTLHDGQTFRVREVFVSQGVTHWQVRGAGSTVGQAADLWEAAHLATS